VRPDEVTQAQLGELMVGSALPEAEARTTTIGSEILLEADNITVDVDGRTVVDDVTLRIHSGEILGVAGVEGNGQFELCQAILGLTDYQGRVQVGGSDMTLATTRQRLEHGLSYIPFDRHDEGLMLDAPLWENLLLTRDEEPAFKSGPFVNVNAVRRSTVATIQRYGVMTPNETVPAYALSGGNQQKLLVGRELDSNPAVLVAAHPTRGVDVGAQAAIWEQLREARDRGLAVLLITADLEELLALSDRIIVMFDGRINAEFQPSEATPELLGTYMTGGTVGGAA
jgi:simple sugar transport system ATP-binding protein